ncbi:hypothetical protein ACIFOT_07015 [Neobacillus sp. NRS-1170]|uniref:hypothetical protein n=1 Tax=Neobacillus sp. NRS-1170 TaxID=3233898 RepID=UPI003D296DA2
MKILKTIAVGIITVLLYFLMFALVFQGAFPSNPEDDKRAEIAEKHAKLRAEGIKQWQKEWMEQQK